GAGESKAPQLWVDKQAFQPVRLRYKEQTAQKDIYFLDYYRDGKGWTFPGRIELYHNAKCVAKKKVYRVRTGQSFSLQKLRQIPKKMCIQSPVPSK
ncbi:MAG: hypothetical protein AAGJ35_14355, partial [Myxococcota bacterium]